MASALHARISHVQTWGWRSGCHGRTVTHRPQGTGQALPESRSRLRGGLEPCAEAWGREGSSSLTPLGPADPGRPPVQAEQVDDDGGRAPGGLDLRPTRSRQRRRSRPPAPPSSCFSSIEAAGVRTTDSRPAFPVSFDTFFFEVTEGQGRVPATRPARPPVIPPTPLAPVRTFPADDGRPGKSPAAPPRSLPGQ